MNSIVKHFLQDEISKTKRIDHRRLPIKDVILFWAFYFKSMQSVPLLSKVKSGIFEIV